jgi:hypothetical protein
MASWIPRPLACCRLPLRHCRVTRSYLLAILTAQTPPAVRCRALPAPNWLRLSYVMGIDKLIR